jgi:hypothetical protein
MDLPFWILDSEFYKDLPVDDDDDDEKMDAIINNFPQSEINFDLTYVPDKSYYIRLVKIFSKYYVKELPAEFYFNVRNRNPDETFLNELNVTIDRYFLDIDELSELPFYLELLEIMKMNIENLLIHSIKTNNSQLQLYVCDEIGRNKCINISSKLNVPVKYLVIKYNPNSMNSFHGEEIDTNYMKRAVAFFNDEILHHNNEIKIIQSNVNNEIIKYDNNTDSIISLLKNQKIDTLNCVIYEFKDLTNKNTVCLNYLTTESNGYSSIENLYYYNINTLFLDCSSS